MNKPILESKSVADHARRAARFAQADGRTACRSAKWRCRAARRRCGCTTPPVRIRTIPSTIDIEKGLAARRRDWILARGDVEEYDGRARKPEDDGLKRGETAVGAAIRPRRRQAAARQAGQECHPAALCAPGHHHRGNEIHRRARKSGPQRAARDGNSFGAAIPDEITPEFVRERDRARPRHHPGQHQPSRNRADDHRPQLPDQGQRQYRQQRRHLAAWPRKSTSWSGRSAGAPTR